MLGGGLQLLMLALVPMLVMALPVVLLLAQLSLWYQARPLRVGEDAVVRLALDCADNKAWPEVTLRPTPAATVMAGPVHVRGKGELLWRIQARESGVHRLVFDTGSQSYEKELAVGDGFLRVSALRPGRDLLEVLLNPGEAPFGTGSPVRSIAIAYPERSAWTCGTDTWVIYWFAVSMVAALAFRRVLGVHV